MSAEKPDLLSILNFAVKMNASDIHFRVGTPPVLRMKGDLVSVKIATLNEEDIGEVCRSLIANTSETIDLKKLLELDGSFDVPGLCRFRFNIFRSEGKLGAVLRLIPTQIPTLDGLGFPPVFKKIAEMDRGFVLVTGATGSGKSTTLAALIDQINSTQRAHIVTIEDPIEFVHTSKMCKITQREVGRDTASFADALRSVLRQDPDIILVGEMRDPESLDIALKAAETGHTVFSTVHTTDAAKTIGRLISMFPPEEQSLVRLRIADCLKATVSQRLLKRAEGTGRVAAQEIMLVNSAIQECIIDPKRTAEIPKFIDNGHDLIGSQTFHQHLSELYKTGVISLEVAKHASGNAADFEHGLNFEKNETNPYADNSGSNNVSSILKLKGGIAIDRNRLHAPEVTLEKQAPKIESEAEESDDDNDKGLLDRMLDSVTKKAK
jgi:twitching motility protein PilT